MTETNIKQRRHDARVVRDNVIADIEKTVARKAVAAVRDEMKIRLYDAQTKALEAFREELSE
jgi:hypothetical protein